MIEKEELLQRVNRLQKVMQKNECGAMLIFQNVDLYYFSGTMQSAYLYIPADREPVLFCRKSIKRAEEECPWTVIPAKNPGVMPRELDNLGMPMVNRIALEFDVLPVSIFLNCRKIFGGAEFVDGSGWIKELRSIKSASEISMLKFAGIKMAEVFSRIPGVIKKGMTEIEGAAELEKIARLTLHEGIIRLRGYNQELFFGHLLSGPSGAEFSFNDGAAAGLGLGPFFPQGCSQKTIGVNEPVVLDYVGIYNGYQVDQTRIAVIGSLDKELENAFQTALEIQDAVVKLARPGATPSSLWDAALEIAGRKGLKNCFMGWGSDQVKFVGHGIGLEVDELPVLARGFDAPLQKGMVFALEPKFVFPGRGMAGIENTWLVGEDGLEKITLFNDEIIRLD